MSLVYRLALPMAILLLWWLVFNAQIVSKVVLPSPFSVFEAGSGLLLGEQSIFSDFRLTLARTLTAWFAAGIIGVPVGLAMGLVPRVRETLAPTVDFFRSIPPIALFPIFILFFGISERAMLALPFYGSLLPVLIGAMYGSANTPKAQLDFAKVAKIGPFRQFIHIVVPSSVPHIASALRLALSLSLVLTIVGEMLLGTSGGLGRQIYEFNIGFETAQMYATIIVVGLLGYALNLGFEFIHRRFFDWGA